jgi:hypothetical protein
VTGLAAHRLAVPTVVERDDAHTLLGHRRELLDPDARAERDTV